MPSSGEITHVLEPTSGTELGGFQLRCACLLANRVRCIETLHANVRQGSNKVETCICIVIILTGAWDQGAARGASEISQVRSRHNEAALRFSPREAPTASTASPLCYLTAQRVIDPSDTDL